MEQWAALNPSGGVGGLMIWVAGDWRGQWLFYSEVAGVVGVSILLDETARAAVKRAQTIYTQVANPEAVSHA